MKHLNKLIILLFLTFLINPLRAVTVSSSTLITPVCSSSNGVLQLNFANVSSYPFVIWWNGSGVAGGSDTITSATQNITLSASSAYRWDDGFTIYLYDAQSNYLGTFEVGVNYDVNKRWLSITCTNPATLTVSNFRNGTSPFSISLVDENDSTLVSGGSPLSISYSSVCPNHKRVYLKVSDANGCTFKAADSSINLSCQGLVISTGTTNASCTNGKAFVTSVSGNTGPYAFKWNNGATTDSIKNLRKGQYTVIVTDSTNCSGIGYPYVNQSVYINVNSTSKAANCNFADGQATALPTGGTSPYTYKWPNGVTSQTNTSLQAGTHMVQVEDAKQCTGEGYAYINSVSPVLVTYSATASSCTSATGSATLSISGGQTPYTIVWHGRSGSGNTMNNLPAGAQSYTVTDANGCLNSGSVVVPPVSVIYAGISGTSPVCPNNNGILYISANSSAGIASYLWNTGATTASISNLKPGSYHCKITDNNGCAVDKYYYLEEASPVHVNLSSKDASCLYVADGSAKAIAIGGQAPYTYQWSNGSNNAKINSLPTGRYYAYATDANGCMSRDYAYVNIDYNRGNSSCYCEITGKVFEDLDSNCTLNNGEETLMNVPVYLKNFGTDLTYWDGTYSFKVPAGTYTLEQLPLYNSHFSPCQQVSQPITVSSVYSGCKQTYDFANITIPFHDVAIFPYSYQSPVPGHYFTYNLTVKNIGNRNETKADATLFDDSRLNFIQSFPAVNAAGGGHYKPANPLVIAKNSSRTFQMQYFTPTNLTIGTPLYYRDSAAYSTPISSRWLDEATPWNNIIEYYNTVTTSFDPNHKNVYPQGEGPEGDLSLEHKKFTYVVQFENNGTANADKVVVIDSLDADLDWSSFRLLDASHNVKTFVDEKGVVTFTFDNINLAYTPVGEYNALAQGYVAYTVNAKSTVQIGTKLENFADIYFDYNAPVRTNTTINTYTKNSGVQSVGDMDYSLVLYPNPNSGVMQLIVPESLGTDLTLEIYNLQGQVVDKTKNFNPSSSISTEQLPSGIYILKVMTAEGKAFYIQFIRE